MKVVVIPEPGLQPDITKEDMDIRWKVLQDLPEVDELVIHHVWATGRTVFDGNGFAE